MGTLHLDVDVRLLTHRAPGGRLAAWAFIGFSLAVFVWGATASFVTFDTPIVSLPVFMSAVLTGPSAALFCLALMIPLLSLLTFVADGYKIEFTIKGRTTGPSRPPVLGALVLLTVVTTYGLHLHTVRVVDGDLPRRESLTTYFKSWAQACAPKQGPVRPIIVAVSGGASRAAVWGAQAPAGGRRRLGAGGPAVFAVSSVSGGSLGVAGYMALLAGMKDGERCADESREARKKRVALLLRRRSAMTCCRPCWRAASRSTSRAPSSVRSPSSSAASSASSRAAAIAPRPSNAPSSDLGQALDPGEQALLQRSVSFAVLRGHDAAPRHAPVDRQRHRGQQRLAAAHPSGRQGAMAIPLGARRARPARRRRGDIDGDQQHRALPLSRTVGRAREAQVGSGARRTVRGRPPVGPAAPVQARLTGNHRRRLLRERRPADGTRARSLAGEGGQEGARWPGSVADHRPGDSRRQRAAHARGGGDSGTASLPIRARRRASPRLSSSWRRSPASTTSAAGIRPCCCGPRRTSTRPTSSISCCPASRAATCP